MSITVHSEDFEMQVEEENGAPVRLKTRQRVSGINTGLSPYARAYAVLNSGALAKVNDVPAAFSGLRLVRRSVEFVPKRNDNAYVVCEYTRWGSQDDNNFVFSGGTNLSQITTQKDINGNAVVLNYTYPDGTVGDPQGADVPVHLPQSSLSATGIMEVDYPIQVSRLWVGAVNLTAWAGGNAGQWLCTDCSWESVDLTRSPRWWRFTFQFQLNLQYWNPIAWWKDPTTGAPPPDLIWGVGKKMVDWYTQLDYRNTPPYFIDL